MLYTVKSGDQEFGELTARVALAKLQQLDAAGHRRIYIYDAYGDPMGHEELEYAAVMVTQPANRAASKIAESFKAAALSFVALPFIVLFAILKLVTMPFARPRRLTPEQVAMLLRKCIDGTATDSEIDYFISAKIADSRLNEIKDEVGAVFGPGWASTETRQTLQDLLHRVEAMVVPAA